MRPEVLHLIAEIPKLRFSGTPQPVGSHMAVTFSAICGGRALPPGRFLLLISVKGWVKCRTIARLE
jgi:hypothetical protein